MKCFKKFKAVFCLVFAFMFMFGNAFFVQVSAASTIEFDEIQPLYLESQFRNGTLTFDGIISYKCVIDPYKGNKGKKIVDVDMVQIDLSEGYACDGCKFEQKGYVAKVMVSGEEVKGRIFGTIEEISGRFMSVNVVEIPFVYHLPNMSISKE